jgi:hypothetical protein
MNKKYLSHETSNTQCVYRDTNVKHGIAHDLMSLLSLLIAITLADSLKKNQDERAFIVRTFKPDWYNHKFCMSFPDDDMTNEECMKWTNENQRSAPVVERTL